jgi:hypothetical protein
MVWKRRPFKVGLSLGNRINLLGLSPENMVDGAQWMSDVCIAAREKQLLSFIVHVISWNTEMKILKAMWAYLSAT